MSENMMPELTTYRVDFIDKDDARHVFLCLIEQISYAACAHADKHFDKVTTADREERHACLACNGFGKQRFTCSRRTYKQHAVRDITLPFPHPRLQRLRNGL